MSINNILSVEHENIFGGTTEKDLDDDCLLEIFEYLSFSELLTVDKVCSRWRNVGKVVWGKIEKFKFTVDDDKIDTVAIFNHVGLFSPYLTELNIFFRIPFYDTFLKMFAKHESLRCIKLGGRFIENDIILSYLPERLDEICDKRSYFLFFVSKDFKMLLKSYKKLRSLTLNFFIIESLVLKAITQIRELRYLDLSRCSFMGKPSLIPNLINLEHLNLSHSFKIKDDLVIGLAKKCQNLKYLNISESSVSREAIKELSKLEKLEELFVYDVSEFDNSLLDEFHKLKTLDCSCCKKLTDFSIRKYLKNSLNLEHFFAIDTKITSDTLIYVAKALEHRRVSRVLCINASDDVVVDYITKADISHFLNVEAGNNSHHRFYTGSDFL